VGATFKEVSKSIVANVEIPLPSLAEQRRIAAILDKADALRAKRREALAHLDRLAQSIFVEMFGDPVSNSNGWPRLALGELLSGIDSGWSPVCLDRPAEAEEWGVLKLGAVTSCVYNQQANKALPRDVEADPSIEVQPGDLLFSRKNTHELVAACALVEVTRPRLMMSDLIFRLQVRDEAKLNKTFLQALLTNPRKRAEVQKLAGGSAGSMPNISKAKLLAMQVEVPPIALQQDYAYRIGKVRRIRASSQTAVVEADSLFTSLEQRAFQGEL
jgi:type I restriction enzyme S subunit